MKLAMHKTATAGAVFALSASAVLAGAPAANASGTGTACPSARVCFYFNSDFQGARADYANSDATMGNELFTDGPAGRNGWGVQVNNNAASLINNTLRVHHDLRQPRLRRLRLVHPTGGAPQPGRDEKQGQLNPRGLQRRGMPRPGPVLGLALHTARRGISPTAWRHIEKMARRLACSQVGSHSNE